MRGKVIVGLVGVCSTVLLVNGVVCAAPVALNDSSLDVLTAGAAEASGSGGAIIGNSSSASIQQSGGVSLDGTVQAEAMALNLVNSAESTVANGVNVWDGKEVSVTGDRSNPAFSVNQSNMIQQEQRRSASMPNYSRPEADTMKNIVQTSKETHNDQVAKDNTLVDMVKETRKAKNTSNANVDTTIAAGVKKTPPGMPQASFDTNVGKGLAIAGQLGADLDGGEIQIGMAVGGAVSAFKDTDTSDSGYGGMQVGDEQSDFALYGRLILPSLTLDINGSGCGVAMGSCDATGTSEEQTEDIRDNTIIDTLATSSIGASESTLNSNEVYRSPFELNNAQAEYIVVDDSSLEVATTFTLTLTGSAQNGAKAMNLVNSTGSAVANGVNVSRTSQSTGGNMLALTQSNVISHSR